MFLAGFGNPPNNIWEYFVFTPPEQIVVEKNSYELIYPTWRWRSLLQHKCLSRQVFEILSLCSCIHHLNLWYDRTTTLFHIPVPCLEIVDIFSLVLRPKYLEWFAWKISWLGELPPASCPSGSYAYGYRHLTQLNVCIKTFNCESTLAEYKMNKIYFWHPLHSLNWGCSLYELSFCMDS